MNQAIAASHDQHKPAKPDQEHDHGDQESDQSAWLRSPAELLTNLRARDVVLERAGNRLRYGAPPGVMTAELLTHLARNKDEFLALLAADDPEVGWRVTVMRSQVSLGHPFPVLVAREGVSGTAGTCVSCGDVLAKGQRHRCDACKHAAWLVVQEVQE